MTSPIETTPSRPLPDEAEKAPPRPPRLAIAIVVIGLALGGAAWALLRPQATERSKTETTMKVTPEGVSIPAGAPEWRYVTLETAREEDALPPLPAPGRVAFDERRSSAVGSPLPGRLERVLVRTGDRVKEGARLFLVRSANWADLDRELQSAKQAVEIKKRTVARLRDLVAMKAVPEKDLMLAEAELRDSELTARTAIAKQQSLRVEAQGNGLFWLSAPRQGTVVELNVLPDQEVSPDRERPLLRISDLDEVLVLADLQEADAAELSPGEIVTVRSPDGRFEKTGKADYVSDVVDPVRRTVEVRVRAHNADRALRPNAFVEIVIRPDATHKHVVVPLDAVVTDGEKRVVFVERSPGHLTRQRVITGRQREGRVEITTGLRAGERFVARGALLLLNTIDLATDQ